MIHELLTILLPIGKLLMASSLLLVFYWLIFKDKSSHNESRLYLSSIAFLTILLSQFKLVVYTPPTRIVEIEALNNSMSFGTENSSQMPVSQESFQHIMTLPNFLFAVYAVVALILFSVLLRQYFQIFRLKKRGLVERKEVYSLVVNSEVPTPFSFGRNIFIGPDLTGDKREMIVQHEYWHIKHHHYRDVMLMEILVRLFWFNPIMWMIRKELRSVHEFQADHSVLNEGYDLFHYQTFILEEVMGNHSCLANGFNQSFTKKRFIMMKNTNPSKFSPLRQVVLIPLLLLVFCLFSFTKGQGQVKYVEKPRQLVQKDTSMVSKTTIPSIAPMTDKQEASANSSKDEKSGVLPPDSLLNKVTAGDMLKSLETCLEKTQVSIDTYKKLVGKSDFSQNGVEVVSILYPFGTPYRGDGTFMDGTMLSEKFLATIKQSDIQQALQFMNEYQQNVHQIYTSNVPTKEKLKQYLELRLTYMKNDFVNKILIQELTLRQPYRPRTISKTDSQLKGEDIHPFKLKIELLEDKRVHLTGFEGCNYRELKYFNPSFNQLIDRYGMLNKNEIRDSHFIFEVTRNPDGMTLIGIKGTKWSKIVITGPNGICSQVIDQNGAVN